jgi:hypothetical protein
MVLPRSAFADVWSGKPAGDVAIGLRVLSEADVQTARAEAAKLAVELHPEDGDDRIDAFNDALVRWAVARGTTDPNDVRRPYFEAAEDTVRDALTSHGALAVYEALERLTIETSPLEPPASNDDLHSLADVLRDPERVGFSATAFDTSLPAKTQALVRSA